MAHTKIKRNQKKCEQYRARIGKPRGPGKKGNKSGKNFTPISGWKEAKK